MNVISKRIVAIFVSLIIVLSGLTALPCHIFSQSIEDELKDVKQQREETKKKIEEAKAAEQLYIGEISEVENQLLSALSELDGLRLELADAEEKVKKTSAEMVLKEEDLKIIEDELEENIHILNNRVSFIYKKGSNNILELILNSKTFVEFSSNLKLINLFARQGNENVHQIKETRNALISTKKVITELRDKQKEHEEKVSNLVIQSEKKTDHIESLYNQKKSLLSQTRASKQELINMEAELAKKEEELKKILESYKYGIPPSGKLLWPVSGQIVSGFGYRIHPVFGINRFHSGIDIAAPYGTPVKAAAGGEVIQAGYFGGYGYSVMLYHGGGYATWYAHLSSIKVSIGQMVERGKSVGNIGSTGWSTGPHLHFEIRIKGAPQDPMGFLP
jgi:murein DD-endopeptidase MepM/ murein hydrolase activator NlpD